MKFFLDTTNLNEIGESVSLGLVDGVTTTKAAAAYISPFIGRLDDIGQNGLELVRAIVEIYNAPIGGGQAHRSRTKRHLSKEVVNVKQ